MSFPQGDLYNFSLARFYANQKSTVIPSAPAGLHLSGRSGLQRQVGNQDQRCGTSIRASGLAWDPSGDGKTAIRAGAGIAHDFIRQDLHLNTSSVSPFRLTVVNTGINLDNPWAGYPGGNPFPYNFNKQNPVFTPYGSYLPVPPDMKTQRSTRGTSRSSGR